MRETREREMGDARGRGSGWWWWWWWWYNRRWSCLGAGETKADHLIGTPDFVTSSDLPYFELDYEVLEYTVLTLIHCLRVCGPVTNSWLKINPPFSFSLLTLPLLSSFLPQNTRYHHHTLIQQPCWSSVFSIQINQQPTPRNNNPYKIHQKIIHPKVISLRSAIRQPVHIVII